VKDRRSYGLDEQSGETEEKEVIGGGIGETLVFGDFWSHENPNTRTECD